MRVTLGKESWHFFKIWSKFSVGSTKASPSAKKMRRIKGMASAPRSIIPSISSKERMRYVDSLYIEQKVH